MQTACTKVIFKGKPVHLHSLGEISVGSCISSTLLHLVLQHHQQFLLPVLGVTCQIHSQEGTCLF